MNDLATAAIASSAVQMAKRSSAGEEAGGGGGATESAGQQPAAGAAAAAAAPSTPQPPEVARGALIALEGLDRSGKTTQVKLLEQRFVELGRKVKVMRFPGGCFFWSSSFVLCCHASCQTLSPKGFDDGHLYLLVRHNTSNTRTDTMCPHRQDHPDRGNDR